VYRWTKRGEKQASGLFREFCMALREADAVAELRCIRRLNQAACDGDWRAAAWMLERRFPERWGRRRA
jgi:transposase